MFRVLVAESSGCRSAHGGREFPPSSEGNRETSGGEDIADTIIEPLDHPGGLRMPRTNQPMFNTVLIANGIENVSTGRFAFSGGATAVDELLTIVGEDLPNFDRAGFD